MRFLAHVTGPTYRKTGKCFHLDVEISEAEKSRYGLLPGLNEKWCEVDFTVLEGADAAEAAYQQPKTQEPGLMTDDQRKLLWVLWGTPAVIKGYNKSFGEEFGEIKTKEDCERVFKAKAGIEHLHDLSKEYASTTIDKLQEFAGKQEEPT